MTLVKQRHLHSLGSVSTAAQHALLEDLTTPLLGYFARRVDTDMDAQDCLAETLLTLWRRRDEVPASIRDVRPYSFGIARFVLKNYQRSRSRTLRLQRELVEEARIDRSEPGQSQLRVRDSVKSLPEVDRELVMLVHWDGLTIVEAGIALGLSRAAALKRHSRALARLRGLLGTPRQVETSTATTQHSRVLATQAQPTSGGQP